MSRARSGAEAGQCGHNSDTILTVTTQRGAPDAPGPPSRRIDSWVLTTAGETRCSDCPRATMGKPSHSTVGRFARDPVHSFQNKGHAPGFGAQARGSSPSRSHLQSATLSLPHDVSGFLAPCSRSLPLRASPSAQEPFLGSAVCLAQYPASHLFFSEGGEEQGHAY